MNIRVGGKMSRFRKIENVQNKDEFDVSKDKILHIWHQMRQDSRSGSSSGFPKSYVRSGIRTHAHIRGPEYSC